MIRTSLLALPMALSFAFAVPAFADPSEPATQAAEAAQKVRYRTATVGGVEVFYREAGRADSPAILLLHGFPTSSHMYRNLIPALADRYRVIAPDYPGFGYSAMPDRADFAYTFDRFAAVIDELTLQLGLERYALYVMDYGAPVGFRLAAANPDKISALIVQNGNAYDEGIAEFWDPLKAYWRTGAAAEREALRAFTETEATRWQYTHGVPDVSLVSPDTVTVDQAFLDRPGNDEIQLDLFYDYRNNLPLYAEWQAVLPRAPAADPRGLGPERRDLRRSGRRPVHPRQPARGDPSARHGPLRARNARTGDCGADARLPRPRARAVSAGRGGFRRHWT